MSEIVNQPIISTKEHLSYLRWGSMSFGLGLLSFGAFCVFFATYAYLIKMVPGFWPPQDLEPGQLSAYPTFRICMGFGSLFLCCFFASYTAFILGIVGGYQSHTQRNFAKWGIFLSVSPLLLLMVLFFLSVLSRVAFS